MWSHGPGRLRNGCSLLSDRWSGPWFPVASKSLFLRLLEFASVRAVGRSFPSLAAGGIVIFPEVTSQRGAAPHQAWGASNSPPRPE